MSKIGAGVRCTIEMDSPSSYTIRGNRDHAREHQEQAIRRAFSIIDEGRVGPRGVMLDGFWKECE